MRLYLLSIQPSGNLEHRTCHTRSLSTTQILREVSWLQCCLYFPLAYEARNRLLLRSTPRGAVQYCTTHNLFSPISNSVLFPKVCSHFQLLFFMKHSQTERLLQIMSSAWLTLFELQQEIDHPKTILSLSNSCEFFFFFHFFLVPPFPKARKRLTDSCGTKVPHASDRIVPAR